MKRFRRFMNWLVQFLFPHAVTRLVDKRYKERFHKDHMVWQSKMGGPPKECVNEQTGEDYYEYCPSPKLPTKPSVVEAGWT